MGMGTLRRVSAPRGWKNAPQAAGWRGRIHGREGQVMRIRTLRRRAITNCAVASLCATVAGCTFGRRVGSDPVEFNKSLADANNRILLLNVARASKKHPLYFSEVSELNEALKVTGGLDL